MSVLFEPLKLGPYTLKNRIIMAPLTRSRAVGEGRIPNDLMTKYYKQRSSAGMILTEATAVTPMGVGYAHTPGIWSKDQVNAWRKITDAVHAEGGVIFMQLWHVGRISDPMFLNGELPVAPSAIKPKGHVSLVRPLKEYVTPRALDLHEIKEVIEAYKVGAANAKEAGFDGVELHAANGYLMDQFLQDSTNKRTDEYGGPIENRARLLLEVTDALISVWGADKVGVHLAPRRDSHDMGDSTPAQTFGYVAEELNKRQIAFIFTREYEGEDSLTPMIRQKFSGVLIANEKMTKESGEQVIATKKADAVSFGRWFISNPDLPKRLLLNAPLNELNPQTIYAAGEEGYTDYPFLPA
ncbi:alkene reductase [Bdellovibrio sp. HCB117]|uniref:alkene reductase n=1 Tax=Bdellovibrio sp. HCB117 TaxID=3394359 RepID=UPI0039B4EBD6